MIPIVGSGTLLRAQVHRSQAFQIDTGGGVDVAPSVNDSGETIRGHRQKLARRRPKATSAGAAIATIDAAADARTGR